MKQKLASAILAARKVNCPHVVVLFNGETDQEAANIEALAKKGHPLQEVMVIRVVFVSP